MSAVALDAIAWISQILTAYNDVIKQIDSQTAGRSCQITHEYFARHPEAREGVLKAYYAYHAPHFRLDLKAHNFGGALRESQCHWCGRSREQVRWDELPHGCQKRPELSDAVDVLLSEEQKTIVLLNRAADDAPRLIAKLGLSGETLAVLHHTYGYDPEMVAGAMYVPPQMLAEYQTAMETERVRSRSAQVKEVITAQAISR